MGRLYRKSIILEYLENGQISGIKTEIYDNTRYKLSFWSDKAYESSIYQTVGNLSSGTYKLSIDAMGDTGLETAELYIKIMVAVNKNLSQRLKYLENLYH